MENNKLKEEYGIIRAAISPNATESNDYDFEAVAVPANNKQLRRSYENDEYFYQVLRTAKENIQTERLDSGLPLFDNHPYDNSASNILGITTEYFFDERGLIVRCKLGARADEALRNDIKNGIIKTVSIEGVIENYSVVRNAGEIPIYYADLWVPESLSFAPVPNDIEAQIEIKRKLQSQKEKEIENKSVINSLIKKFK
jgi:hypothetical protein